MTHASRHCRKPRSRQSGVASIEFVLVFPVLLLFFGLVNFAHYMSVSMKIAQAAALATDVISRDTSPVTTADFTDAFTAVELAVTPLPVANVRVDIYDYDGAGILRWKKSSANGQDCAAPNPGADPMKSLLANQTTPTDVIVAVVCMAYVAPVPDFPGLTALFQNIVIRRAMYLRPRNGTQLMCGAC